MTNDSRIRVHGEEEMRIAIVGSGLSTALFLRRAGPNNIMLFEQVPELGEIDAGIR